MIILKHGITIPLDPVVTAYINAVFTISGETVSVPKRQALSKLKRDMDIAGIWGKAVFLLPFIGNSYSAQRVAFNDPQKLMTKAAAGGDTYSDAGAISGASGLGFQSNIFFTGNAIPSGDQLVRTDYTSMVCIGGASFPMPDNKGYYLLDAVAASNNGNIGAHVSMYKGQSPNIVRYVHGHDYSPSINGDDGGYFTPFGPSSTNMIPGFVSVSRNVDQNKCRILGVTRSHTVDPNYTAVAYDTTRPVSFMGRVSLQSWINDATEALPCPLPATFGAIFRHLTEQEIDNAEDIITDFNTKLGR